MGGVPETSANLRKQISKKLDYDYTQKITSGSGDNALHVKLIIFTLHGEENHR